MRTAAWEAASQIALRDCSKVPVGESQYIRFSWKGNSIPWRTFYKRFFASHEDLMSPWRDLVLLYIWEDARIEIIKSVPKNIQLSKDLSHQIPWSTECLTPPWIPGVVEGRQLQQHGVQSPQRPMADVQSWAMLLVSASLWLTHTDINMFIICVMCKDLNFKILDFSVLEINQIFAVK